MVEKRIGTIFHTEDYSLRRDGVPEAVELPGDVEGAAVLATERRVVLEPPLHSSWVPYGHAGAGCRFRPQR